MKDNFGENVCDLVDVAEVSFFYDEHGLNVPEHYSLLELQGCKYPMVMVGRSTQKVGQG